MMGKYLYVLSFALLLSTGPAQSREFNGLTLPDHVMLAGTEKQLQLNGVGVRTKFVFDIYIGALYTEKPATTRDEVFMQKGPNRVLMHFVYDEVGVDKLVAGWNEGFEENQADDKLELLMPRISRFNEMFSNVYAGDTVVLDYVPGRGTAVNIRGEEKGVIEGEDFNRALLDIWLGEEPADDDLKQSLLRGD